MEKNPERLAADGFADVDHATEFPVPRYDVFVVALQPELLPGFHLQLPVHRLLLHLAGLQVDLQADKRIAASAVSDAAQSLHLDGTGDAPFHLSHPLVQASEGAVTDAVDLSLVFVGHAFAASLLFR